MLDSRKMLFEKKMLFEFYVSTTAASLYLHISYTGFYV